MSFFGRMAPIVPVCVVRLGLATALSLGVSLALAQSVPGAPQLPDAVASAPADATLDAGAEQLARQAWEGFRRGDPQPAAAALPSLRSGPLGDWIAYWALEPKLRQATQADIDAFARSWPGTLPLRRLRGQWLVELARRNDWAGFLAVYRDYDANDTQLQCRAAQALFETTGDDTSAEVLRLWKVDPSGGSGCNAAAQSLLTAGRIDQRALWLRLRGFFDAGQSASALHFTNWLPPAAVPLLRKAVADPLGVALDAARQGLPDDELQRRVLTLALLRMAGDDPQQALRLIDGPLRALPRDERADIAWRAARAASSQLLPGADAMFQGALHIDPTRPVDADSWRWGLRAGLRAANWALVRRCADALLARSEDDDEALYWKGVALRETGHAASARVLWRGIAEPWGYYGQLATEALGQPLQLPADVPAVDPGALAAAASRTDLHQALLLYRIDAFAPAASQWALALDGARDADLHAAAQLACDRRAWLLCISASERMKNAVDWKQRYVMPFRDAVAQASRSSGVGEPFIYGIMRQESRFAASIRSWAGADGLMQLMPATARWVARKIGMGGFQPELVTQVGTNVELGSAYLGMLLQRFDGSQAMAAAGYNAGPGRPARWLSMPLPGKPGLDGAVFAESIPIEQTRDYVKRVLANATVYAALLGARRASLESRLALAASAPPANAAPMP